MINEKFNIKISGQPAVIICNKFNAFDCLTFISFLIGILPEKNENYLLTRKGAEYLVMNIMDTGIVVELTIEQKNSYKQLSMEEDYFASLFKLAFMIANKEQQTRLTDELVKLYRYNNAEIDSTSANMIFSNPKTLFSALLHAVRFNYNDFFIIGEC